MSNARQVYQCYLDEARPALRYRLGADLLLHSCLPVEQTQPLAQVDHAVVTGGGLRVVSAAGLFLYTSQAQHPAQHAEPPDRALVCLDIAEDLEVRLRDRGVSLDGDDPPLLEVAQQLMILLRHAVKLTDDVDVLREVLVDLLRDETQRSYRQLYPAG